MSINKWSIVDISETAEINRITNRNIYTILECEEDLEEESSKEVAVEADVEAEVDSGWEKELGYEFKNEKKIDVFKVMKDYVKKNRNKYSSV